MLLAAALALLLALVVGRARRDPGSTSAARAPVEDPAPRPGDRAAAPSQRPGDPLGVLNSREVWRAQVAAALRRAALRQLGRPLTPQAEARLVDAVATVGPAARGLDRDTLDPDDPASIAAVRERTAALLEADRVCHDELGIGMAELVRTLDPRRIEDGAATDAPRE